MKRLLTATIVAAFALAGSVSTAHAANQPSQGEHSVGRAETGSAGPHCHILVVNDASPFDIQVFPSHKGHAHAGNEIFNADPNCDGDIGV